MLDRNQLEATRTVVRAAYHVIEETSGGIDTFRDNLTAEDIELYNKLLDVSLYIGRRIDELEEST